uniref:E3 ubiquitin-protein ligase HECW1/2 N-terminal domain-containing protein n=1 Tax=Romanomermis culicivorax TaxID=13658 RepID=A0A915J242_ROMCU
MQLGGWKILGFGSIKKIDLMESTKSGPPLRSYYLTPQLSCIRREVKRIRCHSYCRSNRTSSKVSGAIPSNNNQLQQQKLKTSSNLSLLAVDKTVIDLQISDLNNNETTIVNLSWNIEEPTNMLDWIGLYMIGEKNPFRYLDYKCNNACSKANGTFAWKLGSDLIEKLRTRPNVKVCFKYYDGISGKLRALSPILRLILPGIEDHKKIAQSEPAYRSIHQTQLKITNVSCSGLQSIYNHELRIFHEADNKIVYKSGSQRGACPSWNLSDVEIMCQNRTAADSIVFEIKIATSNLDDATVWTYAGNDTTTNNNNDQSGTQIGIGKNISCFANERFNNDPSRLNDYHVTNDFFSGNLASSSSESDTEMTLRLKNERKEKPSAGQHGDYGNDIGTDKEIVNSLSRLAYLSYNFLVEPRENTSLEIGRAVSHKASRSVEDYSGEDLVLAVLEGQEESNGAYGSSGTVDDATVRNCHKIGPMLTTASPVICRHNQSLCYHDFIRLNRHKAHHSEAMQNQCVS